MESQRPYGKTFQAQDGFHPLRAQPHLAANQNRRLNQSLIGAVIDFVIQVRLCCRAPIRLGFDTLAHLRSITVLPKR